jgi:hypothetical protein
MRLTELEGIQNPLVEQDDRGAHADPDTAHNFSLVLKPDIIFRRFATYIT